MTKVAPSILSADYLNLGRDIQGLERNGADYIHFDVMDGSFVPNISFGIPVLKAVRTITKLPLDVHLMIREPLHLIERFMDSGADILTVHVESDTEENVFKTLQTIRDRGVHPAITLKPATPAETIFPFLSLCDQVLVMTVEPGFGGQKFMNAMVPKIRAISEYIRAENLTCDLEVDGGINPQTAAICRENGANVLVSGSTYFRSDDPAAFIRALRGE